MKKILICVVGLSCAQQLYSAASSLEITAAAEKVGKAYAAKKYAPLRNLYIEDRWYDGITKFIPRYFNLPTSQEKLDERIAIATINKDERLKRRIQHEGVAHALWKPFIYGSHWLLNHRFGVLLAANGTVACVFANRMLTLLKSR